MIFSKDNNISFDLFSAIVFIVAGPTIGFTLKHFHRYLFSVIYFLFRGKADLKESVGASAKFRLKASDSQKNEIDREEAIYDFCMSVPVALLILSAYYIISNLPSYSSIDPVLGIVAFVESYNASIHVPLYILSAILFFGAFIQYQYALVPLYERLYKIVSKDA